MSITAEYLDAKMVVTRRENSNLSITASIPFYVSTMTKVPDNFCETLQSLQKTFIWDGRKAKNKYSTLIEDYYLGAKRIMSFFQDILPKVHVNQGCQGQRKFSSMESSC